MAPVKNNGQRSLLATGEPVELARRFCIANRFYGSRVLLGPRTFELASKILVARPIDFLSGVDVRERHEIYEPVALALDASRDQITRRDAFWNGVVLYREKRWAEAYSKFQSARGPGGRGRSSAAIVSPPARAARLAIDQYAARRVRAAGFEENGIPVRDPGFDRAIAPNARDRAALRGTHRFVDCAVPRGPAGAHRARHHGDAAISPALSALRIFHHGGNLRDLFGHVARS